ncbi:MAG: aspartyl-tRNA(Asn)/glutamyl-tRNA(Gln) amidotransferase subunit, partial [Actinomycetota bacterium]|nr:aspartyl-tRNA(Asn)/glutamyl-tRNA(Gln) amidotransferase subunit [Actinomycetota bacterium]
SRVFADRVAPADARAVEVLRAAGAIIVGLTRSHEFGWGITTRTPDSGGTANPWNLSRIAGGSSGGSAAAVASQLVPAALGTDTGGSVRIPAAFCGVMGLKPTFGTISTGGVVPLAPSLDHVGAIARSGPDLAVLLEVLRRGSSGRGVDSVTRDTAQIAERGLNRVRFGLLPDLNVPPLIGEYADIFDGVLSAVAGTGATVLELRLELGSQALGAFAAIQGAEAFHVHHRVLGTFPSKSHLYGADVRARLAAAAERDLGSYLAACDLRSALKEDLSVLLEQVDVLLTPMAACAPSEIASPDVADYGSARLPLRELVMGYTAWQDLTGLPACNVPVALDSLGLPVSVQLTGAAHMECQLLDIATQLRHLTGSDRLLPPTIREGQQ